MRSIIYKYPFEVEDEFTLRLPRGAIFLSVQVQRNQPVMWFQVFDETTYFDDRQFEIIPTGVSGTFDRLMYLGTFQLFDAFVGHLYEVVTDGS